MLQRYFLSIGLFIFVSAHICCSIFDPDSNIVKTLVNENQAQGTYSVTWNQQDKDNKQVSDGRYHAILKLEGSEKVASFNISSKAEHVTVPYDSYGNAIFEFTPPISVNSSNYAKGDTVCIMYELGNSQQVKLEIEK